MVRCALNVSHPKFARQVGDDPAIKAGLKIVCETVAKNRNLSHWVNHPMPGYPKYQNRIWKWDFSGDESASSTRKGWRLFAYVPDPSAANPVPADAFFFFEKQDDPGGSPQKYITAALKRFFSEEASQDPEERYRRQIQPDGQTRSLCMNCGDTVYVGYLEADRDVAENQHACQKSLLRF